LTRFLCVCHSAAHELEVPAAVGLNSATVTPFTCGRRVAGIGAESRMRAPRSIPRYNPLGRLSPPSAKASSPSLTVLQTSSPRGRLEFPADGVAASATSDAAWSTPLRRRAPMSSQKFGGQSCFAASPPSHVPLRGCACQSRRPLTALKPYAGSALPP
jgi:hypothetical protein